MEESGKASGRFCSTCRHTSLDRKRQLTAGGNGLCPDCEQHARSAAAEAGAEPPPKGKRWEDVVLDELVTMVTDTEGRVISYEMRDDMSNMLGSNSRSRRGGNGCGTDHQRRPDILWLVRDKNGYIAAAIMVEVDEHSHSDRSSECEGGKVHDSFQAIVNKAQEEGKSRLGLYRTKGEVLVPYVKFLRFNPNACDAPGGPIRLAERIQVLAARIRKLVNTPAERYQELSRKGKCNRPHVELLYYHTQQGGKHLAYYEQNKDAFHLRRNKCPRSTD